MLSLSKVKSHKYYMKDDYYTKDATTYQKLTNWYGNAAKGFGLKGEVKESDYDNLIKGILPDGTRIGIKKNGKIIHDAGRDLTFSAPKSVSIMALVYEDSRLLAAHDKAVKVALDEIEKNYFATRVKQGKNLTTENTNNLIAAAFRHNLSRDLDPQLHTHAVVMNITKSKAGKYKSGFFDNIYDHKKHLGALYRTELAFEVKKLGYDIEIKGQNCYFEIKSVPHEINDLFSSRSKKIKETAKELFGSNPTQKQLEKITLSTRNSKKENEKSNYQQIWQEKIKDLINLSLDNKPDFKPFTDSKNHDFTIKIPKSDKVEVSPRQRAKNAIEAVNFAIKHLSERQTVFSHKQLTTTALNDRLGQVVPEDIDKIINKLIVKNQLLVKRDDNLIKKDPANLIKSDEISKKENIKTLESSYTTSALLKKEIAILNLMKEGKSKYKPIIDGKIDQYLNPEFNLNKGQKKAANLILTTKDRIVGIQGYAGVGKTYMLKAVNDIATKQGYQLLGIASTGPATRNLENEAGIKSITLEKFLKDYNGVAYGRGTKEGRQIMKSEFANKIIILDEAGMVSTIQKLELLTISKELDFKIISSGDYKQLDAVGAGTPYHQLQKAGMSMAYMTEIKRQTNPILKTAVYNVIGKDIKAAFDKINYIEIPREVTTFADNSTSMESNNELMTRITEKMVDHFMSLKSEQRQSTLIVTPANESRKLANDLISDALYKERANEKNNDKKAIFKLINLPDISKFPLVRNFFNQNSDNNHTESIIFKDKNLSEAAKTRAYNYDKGDVILFNKNRNYIGAKKDEYCQVIRTNQQKNLVTIKNKHSEEISFNPLKVKGKSEKIYFEVFKTNKRIFKEGDIITFTRSLKNLKLVNSDQAKITKITDSKIELELKRGLGKESKQKNQKITLNKDSISIKHIDFGYAVTAHKAQGLSYNNVLAICESFRENLTNQKNFYVEISRAKENIALFTDNKNDTITRLINNTGITPTAIEHQNLQKEQFLDQKLPDSKKFRKQENKEKQIAIENAKSKTKKYLFYAEEHKDKSKNKLHFLQRKEAVILNNKSLEQYLTLIGTKESITNKEEHLDRLQLNKTSKSTRSKPFINESESRKLKLIEISELEIKERFQAEIRNNLDLNPNTRLEEAIDKAFINIDKKIRFGQKKECEICWHGKAGYVRDYKNNVYFSWGVSKIKDDGTLKFKEVSFEEIKQQRQEAELKAKQAEQEKQQKQQDVALKAAKLFNSYPTSGQSKYLKNKNIDDVKINGIRYVEGSIVIPMRDKDNKIWSLQHIYGNGDKMNFPGGKKQGNFFLITGDNNNQKTPPENNQNINKNKDTIFLAEGFATGVTVHKATNSPVAVCFDAGNIEHVFVNLKTKYPNSNFIIAADNDFGKEVNTGKEKAELVAQKYNVQVILPEFKYEHRYLEKLPDDFNDLEKLSGINEVRRQISKSLGTANYKNINHGLEASHQMQNNNQDHHHLLSNHATYDYSHKIG